MHARSFLLVALALTISVTAAASQSSATTRVSWTVLPFATLGLHGGGTAGDEVTATTPLPTPGAADLARGYVEVPGAVGLTVRSNTAWTVLVEALSPNLGTSDDGTFTWSLDALQVGIGGRTVDVTTYPQVLATGHGGQHELTVDYRAELPEDGLPDGDYEAVLLYTITTQ